MGAKRLSDPADKAAVLERIGRLRPDTERQWGRMTAHQMVCHLNDSFKAALGDRPIRNYGSFLSRTVVKFIALQVPMPWPKGVKTTNEADQEGGGTPPVEFDRDKRELVELIERFSRGQTGSPWSPHPLFGAMSDADWQRWGYLHADHHLRQFGQ